MQKMTDHKHPVCDECRELAVTRWSNEGLNRCYDCNRKFLVKKAIQKEPQDIEKLIKLFEERPHLPLRRSEVHGIVKALQLSGEIQVKDDVLYVPVYDMWTSPPNAVSPLLQRIAEQRHAQQQQELTASCPANMSLTGHVPVILPPPLSRPHWHQSWMDIAKVIAERSYDPRLKVGAIIVSSDNTQMLSVGYNGNYKGGPNEHESSEPGQSGFIHAEINALLKCDYNFPKLKHMYVTHSPCRQCAKCIINGGISSLVYDIPYRDTSGLDLLKSAGVQVFSMSEAILMPRSR